MRNLLKLFFTLFFISLNINFLFAASIDHFEITTSPEKASTGEAIDMTIEAVDSNNAIVTDYTGKVLIFSATNPEFELPVSLQDGLYEFTEADQGKVKFENGVKFNEVGIQDINVYDYVDDKIFGMTEIEITDGGSAESLSIDILSPEPGLTIPKNSITVSGSTKKNHNMFVLINGETKIEGTSNSNGLYEIEVTDLNDGENTIQAKVLNADDEVVGESKEVEIKVENGDIIVKKVTLIPEEVFTESMYEIEVNATSGLEKVEVIVNDELINLEEQDNGLYTGQANAPKEAETYNVDVVLTGEMGNEIKELGAAELTVKTLDSAGETSDETEDNNETPAEEEETITTVEIDEDGEKVYKRDPMKITGLKLVELKSKSILTWDEVEHSNGYNIYKKNDDGDFELIDTVSKPRYEVLFDDKKELSYDFFAVKALGEDSSGSTYEGDLSEATKIKTGPELLILFIVAMFITGLFLIFNMRRS